MNNKQLAFHLAGLGFYIFPCREKDYVSRDGKTFPVKSPYWDKDHLANGQEDATINAGKIRVWWQRWPSAYVGIYLARSGCFAVDIDRHEDKPDGLKAWQGLIEQLAGGSKTEVGPAQQTPSGGYHLLFKAPPGLTLPGKLAPGVDLKFNGYVCTGEPGYKTLDGHGWDTPIPDAPGWMLKLFEDLNRKETARPAPAADANRDEVAVYWLERYAGETAPGRRNWDGFYLACQLFYLDLPITEAEGYMRDYARQVPQVAADRYTEDEAIATLKSVYANVTKKDPAIPRQFFRRTGERESRMETSKPKTLTFTDIQEPPEAPPMQFIEAPAGRPRYVIRTAADALKPQPPIEYIVDKLITAGSLGVWYGEPGAKKTYSLVSLAVCVAAGLSWLEFPTHKAPVLIIDEESGENRLARRISEALRGEGCGEDTPLFYISLAGFKMDSESDPTILQAIIEEYGAKLVILDALADVMGGDENSKEDTQPIFTELRRIADRTGAAIILIHHSNKMGGYRGSSAIKGAVDLMVKVESADGQSIVDFASEKNRDGDKQKWAAIATWLPQEGTFTLRSIIPDKIAHHSKSDQHVLDYLAEHGASPIPDIMNAAATCSPQAARQAVYHLADAGEIRRTNPGAKVAIYELS